ncbi:hypothetical protein VPH35_007889 [Triticum aestivum]
MGPLRGALAPNADENFRFSLPLVFSARTNAFSPFLSLSSPLAHPFHTSIHQIQERERGREIAETGERERERDCGEEREIVPVLGARRFGGWDWVACVYCRKRVESIQQTYGSWLLSRGGGRAYLLGDETGR